ncbi:phage antirepressor KilAC domain-containing protein [Paratractidigestivibacter sp.]|uniref:phage antirepressor KilAC domain-containing protein n=1 Tax=Paratractidigestivibacter sp. TaxID=2847316 RepID=UPI003A92C010
MNDIQVFKNDQFGQVRAARGKNGEPVFVAKDICAILDLGNPRSSIALLDDDEKGVHSVDTPGGRQQMTTVTEPGFYKLVMRSRKPEAKAFQRWVTHEVLPALRRDGGYMVARDETPEQTMARAVLLAQQTIDRQKSRIAELEPKALFADAVAASDGTCLVGELAKMMRQNGVDVGQNRLFAMLREDGYLGNVGQNRNVPTQRAMDLGLFRIKETAVTHSDGHVTINRTPKVTGKGQIYFVKRYCA